MTCPKINNQADLDLTGHMPMFDSFFPYSQKTLGYTEQPSLNFISDKDNAMNPLGKTGYYDPSSYEITIYTDGRHIKDILRSIAHELVHHAQNERGEFDRELDTSPGYALEDGHLWDMEQEAYKDGNSCFRRWEDTYKQQLQESKKMKSSKIQEMVREELKKVLSEQGYGEPTSGLEDLIGQSLPAQQGLGRKSYERPKHKRKRKPIPKTKEAEMMQAKLNLAFAKLGKPLLKVDGRAGKNTRLARRFIRGERKRGESFNDTIARLAGTSSQNVNRLAAKLIGDDAAADPAAMPSQLATADPETALGKIMSKSSKGELERRMAAASPRPASASGSPVASPGGAATSTAADREKPRLSGRYLKPGQTAARGRLQRENKSARSKKAVRILNKLMEKIKSK